LSFSEGRLGKAFLRFAAPFTKLPAVPVIGPGLRWATAKLIPRDARTWVQVQHGPAQGKMASQKCKRHWANIRG